MDKRTSKENSDLQGEGNYDAAKVYDEQATKFAQNAKKVKDSAQLAKEAVDSPEAESLQAAEDEGRSHARK
jgi:hypothetical protein